MNDGLEFAVRAGVIGAGATAVMDLWAVFLKKVFGIPSLDYALVGRWIGHFPHGRFMHANIGRADPVRGEAALGWTAHYAIGIVFAGMLILIWGLDWARNPTPQPAITVGILTVCFPFLVMQPGFGVGMAARRTPNPHVVRLRSLIAHLSFGVGLYVAAWLSALEVRI